MQMILELELYVSQQLFKFRTITNPIKIMIVKIWDMRDQKVVIDVIHMISTNNIVELYKNYQST